MTQSVANLQTGGPNVKNLGWTVTFAGMGINLALGVLYSWSIISGGMVQQKWGWTASQMNLPFSVACLVFTIIMVPAGRMQDRLGPRLVATIGGVLVGLGMLMASLMGNSVWGYVLGFGVLAGAGIGFGYASATPPAVKWFPKAKTGLIAGLVVSGFGLASVYIAPLATALIDSIGLANTVMALGIGFLVVVCGLAQLLKPPPAGFRPEIAKPAEAKAGAPLPAGMVKKEDFTPNEMFKTWQFYLIWFLYACGAGAGLMVISIAKTLGSSLKTGTDESAKYAATVGTVAVVALAIGNGAGRILAGIVSDKLGRKATLIIFMVCQAFMVVTVSLVKPGSVLASMAVIAGLAAIVGANYGSNLSLFPSIAKDYYGLKNFGVNYGLVFTAWGIGGFVLSQVAAYIKDQTGKFTYSYYGSAILLILAALATFALKAPHHHEKA
jgi:nitrate/nitrite transporter NarK